MIGKIYFRNKELDSPWVLFIKLTPEFMLRYNEKELRESLSKVLAANGYKLRESHNITTFYYRGLKITDAFKPRELSDKIRVCVEPIK